MNRIERTFSELEERNEGALVTYLMAGDPGFKETVEYLKGLENGGADLIELGVPFSDPMADGQTIQEAEQRALRNDTTTDTVLEIVREFRKESDIPIVLMSYLNPIHKAGINNFLNNCADAGVDGLIIPDLPIDEAKNYLARAKELSISTIFLAGPNTEKDRVAEIAESTTGFMYLVARYGPTGARKNLLKNTKTLIKNVSAEIRPDLPLCVGFGLSKKQHIMEVIGAGADGAIVGSSIVEKIGEKKPVQEITNFVKSLKEGTLK